VVIQSRYAAKWRSKDNTAYQPCHAHSSISGLDQRWRAVPKIAD
jgi:hypothetical protein